MRIKFLRDHKHRWKPSVVQAFPKGAVADVPKTVAESLIAAGVAADQPKPKSKD